MPTPHVTGPVLVFVGIGGLRLTGQAFQYRPPEILQNDNDELPEPQSLVRVSAVAAAPDVIGDVEFIFGGEVIPPPPRIDPEFRIRSANAPAFLGTAEFGVKPEMRPSYRPVPTDDSDQDDIVFRDEDALVYMDLTWWDERVYSVIASRPVFFDPRRRRGGQYPDSRGTLLGREGCNFPLWLAFPYAGKRHVGNRTPLQVMIEDFLALDRFIATGNTFTAPAVFPGMPNGYRFPEAYLLGPDHREPGTAANRLRLAFHAVRDHRFSSSERLLYDHDMGALTNYNFNQ